VCNGVKITPIRAKEQGRLTDGEKKQVSHFIKMNYMIGDEFWYMLMIAGLQV